MDRNREAVIVSAARTPIGRFQGTLASLTAPELGAVAIKAAVERAGIDPAIIDEVLMGCVVQAGLGQAPARQASIKAGIPPTIGATTVNKICGSGLKTVMLAAGMIKAGDANIIVAGGMESMNNGPYMLPQARFGYRLGHGQLLDATVHDGLWCSFENQHMGNAAEWIAREYGLTRQELDEYAVKSHQKAIAAIDAGRFKDEIVPVVIPQRKGNPIVFDTDESPRRDTSLEALAKLKPAFQPDGMVTAGNSPGITDGAAAVVVMSRAKAEELDIKPLARITGYAQAAVKPLEIFTAPIFAVRRLWEKTGTTADDYDLIEVNEAFAAQTLADGKALVLDWDKVNVNGGAIALGHPIGCSGARILVTLIYALRQRRLKTGFATLCLGGGEAVAMSIELEE
ncbi:MAG: acetyl-CoA C-acetyltransferase [Anaerolineae bacterium]|jgi:acetyl-CoA C-acetyltransferase|nr:acetyl-CoA C-acetyltransferase [Anaerolineae bacterium]MDH7474177.1 acetyl-CoA C-acetyltransferase [Anaerolineae bacterium]